MRFVLAFVLVATLSCMHATGSRDNEANAIVLGGHSVLATGFRSAPVPREWRQLSSAEGNSNLTPDPSREVSFKTSFLEVEAQPRIIRRVIKRVPFKPQAQQHGPPHHVRFQQLKAGHAVAKAQKKLKRVVIKKVVRRANAKVQTKAKAKTKKRALTAVQARAAAKAELKAAAEVLSELTALAEAAAEAESAAQVHESSGSGEGSEDSGPVYILPLAPMSWATLPQGSGSPGGGAPSDTPGQAMGSNSVGASSG